MKTNTEKDEKICLACKRILIGESKLGLCPDCLNKYGSVGVTLGLGGIAFLWNEVWKNRGNIAKSAIDVIKLIKS